MADETNMPDWAPGQPPPWLAPYGAPPVASVPPPDQVAANEYGVVGAGALGPPPIPQVPPGGIPPFVPPPPMQGQPTVPNYTPPPPFQGQIPGVNPRPYPPLPLAPSQATGGRAESGKRQAVGPSVATGEETQGSTTPIGLASFVPPWLADHPGGPSSAPAAEAAPQSDAISGGTPAPKGETTDQALTRTVIDPNASIVDRQLAFSKLSPEQRANLAYNADPKQMAAIASAGMSRDELSAIAARHELARQHEESAQRLDLAMQADTEARYNMLAYQQSVQRANNQTAQVDADAKKLSQEKIDPAEHGVGHFIASVLTAAVGGAVSHYTGGRNLALEELDRKTAQRIEAQKANIANQREGLTFKRNLIAEQLQRSGDLYHAQTVYQLQTYDRAVSELQTKMQDFDPAGSTNLRAAGVLQQLQEQRQQALLAFHQQQIKNNIDTAKANAEIAEKQANAAKSSAEALKIAGQLGGGGAAPAAPVMPKAYYTALNLPEPPADMSVDAYNAWTKMRKEGAEGSKAATEAESTLNSSVILNPITKQRLTNTQGKPIVIRPEDAKEVGDATLATQQTIDSLSDVRRALEADPSTFDRKEWARIQATIGGALPTLAAVYKSKFSSREEEALKDITNLDYDSYRKRFTDKGTGKASLDTIIGTLKRNGDTLLGGKLPDWDGKSPFLDTSKPTESPKTPVDKAEQTIVSRTSAEWTDEDHAIQKMRAAGGDPNTAGRILLDYGINVKDPKFQDDLKRVQTTNVPISKLRLLDELHEKAVRGSPDERAKANAAINEIASSDDGPLGDLATRLATTLSVEGLPLPPEQVR